MGNGNRRETMDISRSFSRRAPSANLIDIEADLQPRRPRLTERTEAGNNVCSEREK
jgi:hypothetical protein